MNDHDAMDAVNEVLEQFFTGEIDTARTINRIAIITGKNAAEHAKAKEAQP